MIKNLNYWQQSTHTFNGFKKIKKNNKNLTTRQGLTCLLICVFFVAPKFCWAQQIQGTIEDYSSQKVELFVFNGMSTELIASTTTNSKGEFSVDYSKNTPRMGLLTLTNQIETIVVLNGEDIQFKGAINENDLEIQILTGEENKLYQNYTQAYPYWKNSLSAWAYLKGLYDEEALAEEALIPASKITAEMSRIQQKEEDVFKQIEETQVASYYLPLKKLLSELPEIAQYETEKIPSATAKLKSIDYSNNQLYTSGLLKEALEYHVWFIQATHKNPEQASLLTQDFIDQLLQQLHDDTVKLNEITKTLLTFFEERKQEENASYLADRLLNETQCSIDQDFAKELQALKHMSIGSDAPNIIFNEHTQGLKAKNLKSLKELEANYKIVVFAGSWCSHCVRDVPKLAKFYSSWKEKNAEVILVAVENDENDYKKFTQELPFISNTDLMHWKSNWVKQYQVFATPSYFVLNKDLEILEKPKTLTDLVNWMAKI